MSFEAADKVTADHLRRDGLPVCAPVHAAPGDREHHLHPAAVRAAGAGRSRWAGPPDRLSWSMTTLGGPARSRRGPRRVPAAGRRRRHGQGRDRARPGSVPAGPQQRRLAPAAGDLRAQPRRSSWTRTGSMTRARSMTGCCSASRARCPRPSCTCCGPGCAAAVLSKARSGELASPLPVGFVYDPAGKVVLDPDASVQQAIRHLFATFARTGSARATVQAFTSEGAAVPAAGTHRPEQGHAHLDAAASPPGPAGPA